jgi:hypothetical protein
LRTTVIIGDEYVADLLRTTGQVTPAAAVRVFVERGLRAAALQRAIEDGGVTAEQLNAQLVESGFDPLEAFREST